MSPAIDNPIRSGGNGGLSTPVKGSQSRTFWDEKNVVGPQSCIHFVAFQHFRQIYGNFFAPIYRRRAFPNDHGFFRAAVDFRSSASATA
jgi:hypothetical protein